MNSYSFLFIVVFLFVLLCMFNKSHATSDYKYINNKAHFEIGLLTGYRVDNLNWSITPRQSSISAKSEIEYENLEICETGIYAELIAYRLFLLLKIANGNILDGIGTDSDYNNEHNLQFKSQFSVDNDSVDDLSFGIGYQFIFLHDSLKILPLIGLSQHKQKLRMTNGKLIYPSSKDIDGLDSTYYAEWEALWYGLKFIYDFQKNYNIFCSLKYNDADYRAVADWNLREDFAHPTSFEHKAEGYGIIFNAGLSFNIYDKLDLGLDYLWRKWQASDGSDRTYFQTGETVVSHLDKVEWESQSIRLNLSVAF